MKKGLFASIILSLLYSLIASAPSDDLIAALNSLKTDRELKGIQLQLTKKQEVIFNTNLG